MSDRIVVMNHGRIEQVDTPSRMYERPNTRFVADFLGTSNFINAKVEAMSRPGFAVAVISIPLHSKGKKYRGSPGVVPRVKAARPVLTTRSFPHR